MVAANAAVHECFVADCTWRYNPYYLAAPGGQYHALHWRSMIDQLAIRQQSRVCRDSIGCRPNDSTTSPRRAPRSGRSPWPECASLRRPHPGKRQGTRDGV